jgi:transcriptional regulator with XRE-family HTH domain
VIQNRIGLCGELSAARREAGLSQQQLATSIGATREAIARLESGTGSVALTVRVMAAIPCRLRGVARGLSLVDQLINAREKRGWSVEKLALLCGIDPRTVKAIERGDGTLAMLSTMLSKLAPKATRQPIAKMYWDYDRAKMAEADCRFTPPVFLSAILKCFGHIDLDPCWHSGSHVVARRTISLPDCGLGADWSGTLVWVNPPFGDLANWIAKANREWSRGHIDKMLFLLPASRLDIREFFDKAAKNATTLILRERLHFSRLNAKGYPSPFALALACFGCSVAEIYSFMRQYPALVIPVKNDGAADSAFT